MTTTFINGDIITPPSLLVDTYNIKKVPCPINDFINSTCVNTVCQMTSCTLPLTCIVNQNGFGCGSAAKDWVFTNKIGLIPPNVSDELQACRLFNPPTDLMQQAYLLTLLQQSAFGFNFINISGIWQNAFDFLGNCRPSFYCDTSIQSPAGDTTAGRISTKRITNGICQQKFSNWIPCFSANQCTSHRCTAISERSDGARQVNAPNGGTTLTNDVCAPLNDKQPPLTNTTTTPTVSTLNHGQPLEIIILSIVSIGLVLTILLVLLMFKKKGSSRQFIPSSFSFFRGNLLLIRAKFLRFFCCVMRNKTVYNNQAGGRDWDNLKNSMSNNLSTSSQPTSRSSSFALSVLLPPPPNIYNFDTGHNYNGDVGHEILGNPNHSSISTISSDPRGSNVGSIGIINMTNIGSGTSNIRGNNWLIDYLARQNSHDMLFNTVSDNVDSELQENLTPKKGSVEWILNIEEVNKLQ